MYHISPTLDSLRDYFSKACDRYIEFVKEIKNGIYAAILILIILSFGAWASTVFLLKKNTMKLRKMLNIIPLQIIVANNNLKELFLSQKVQLILR